MLQLMSLLNLQYVVYLWKKQKQKKHLPEMLAYTLVSSKRALSCEYMNSNMYHAYEVFAGKCISNLNLRTCWELLMLSWSLRTHTWLISVNDGQWNTPKRSKHCSHLPHFPAVGSASSPMWSHHSAGQPMQLGSQCKTIGESRTLYSLYSPQRIPT